MDTHNTKCKNCGNEIEARYCSHCGQSAEIGRINLSYLFRSLIYSMFHVDKGIFYTMKELTFRPGKTIRDYLDGKRQSQFKPFSYLFILAAIYVFCYINLDLPVYYSVSDIGEVDAIGKDYTSWIINHTGIVQLLFIPIAALFSFLLFRKSKYNYGENLIINTYISGHALLFSIVLLPFMYLLNRLGCGEIVLYFPFPVIIQILMICSVFNMYSKGSRIIRSILWIILQYFAIFFVVTVTMIFHLYFTGSIQ